MQLCKMLVFYAPLIATSNSNDLDGYRRIFVKFLIFETKGFFNKIKK